MTTWGEFADSEPELAAFAAERLGAVPAYLATVDPGGAPRVHPVTPIVTRDGMYVFMEPTSPKGDDLRERGGFALHNGVPDDAGTGGEVSVRGTGHPTLVLGDMNTGAESEALRALRAGDLLTDTWTVAAERVTPAWGTYAGYRAPVRDGKRIDVILATADIEVERVGIDARTEDGIAPSDHLAVHAALEVPR